MLRSRVLVTISISFSIRYIIRSGLLKMISNFCEPVIAITWDQKDLVVELQSYGYEVHIIPEHKRAVVYNDVRRKIDIWFNHFCLQSPSWKIQKIYLDQFISVKNKLLGSARELYNLVKFYLPSYIKRLFIQEEKLLLSATNINELFKFVDDLNIDAVFTVTPFHKQEDLLLRACKYRGKKMLTSILSFDNITKRGWMPVEYDLYIVWNKYNKEQLHRIYPFTINKPIHICGPVQFDFYFSKQFLFPKDEWLMKTGINVSSDRKIILYAGGPKELFPYEPYYLKAINDAIGNGLIQNNPIVLFRCHPMDDFERWKTLVGNSENIVFDYPWKVGQSPGCANVTEEDIKKLCSTLAYTDVHINLCSTMTVDGSVFDKPQIGPAYDEECPKRTFLLEQMYSQEHFTEITFSGGLSLAHTRNELIDLINSSLVDPGKYKSGRLKILESVITFTDGRSAQRVADCIKRYLGNELT